MGVKNSQDYLDQLASAEDILDKFIANFFILELLQVHTQQMDEKVEEKK